MNLRIVLAAVAAAALLPASLALAADYLGGAVRSADAGGQMILTNADGMTLYTWDNDAPGESRCYEQCAVNWPPLLVPAGTAVDGAFTLVDRTGSDMKIVAHNGRPLYLWIGDAKPGDTTGDGVGGTWHTALE